MRKMGIGLQLYTLRSEMEKDFRGSLRKVSEMGYEGVEFAGYGDIPAEEMKALLQELNLQAIGSHVRYPLLTEQLDRQIEYVKTIGGAYIVCPNIPIEERGDWPRLFGVLEEIAREVRRQGLRFAYHNHAFEFESRVDGRFVFDALYERLPAELVQTEMDLGWVQFAGQDPLEYMKTYAGRLPLLHLKDFRVAADGGIDTLELGRGVIALQDVVRTAADTGVDWLIVEQDQCSRPPFESIEISMAWLREHYLANVT